MLTVITKKVFAYGGREFETAGACLKAVVKDNEKADDLAFLKAVDSALGTLKAADVDPVSNPVSGTAAKAATPPKTRGRKPAASPASAAEPKRRGRKPKEAVVPPALAGPNLGRKPSAAAVFAATPEPVAPKKRGRKSAAEKAAALPPVPAPVIPAIPPLPPGV